MVNKNIRKYSIQDSIAFRSTKGDYGGLSNMAGGYPIYINQTWVKSSEALYQALKFPEHPEIQQHIIHVKSPIFAKNISRKHNKEIRKDWNKVRFTVMRFCLEKKLESNYDRFSNLLLSTANKNIVEYSEKDQLWGASRSDNFYIGTNALGRLLMELREKVIMSSVNFERTKVDSSFLLYNRILK